ncbi:hypothetical protein FV222_19810 [Methylobacterium sp. WL103]|uniref:hypothetical protein n=1 Tax=Methylobacterium sp. WL103 TaxID=2603891 RepID=UPI0011C7145D|nr:hypothetical protein [Methylobacterium sp. WL103]TXM95841.1 hypothetical protein FV222_19810 [Methylobacterium sp. WL103]
MASSPNNTELNAAEVEIMTRLIEAADEAERELLPISQSGGDVDRWVERYVRANDLVYAIWQDTSCCLGHDAMIVSGGQELLASDVGWAPTIGAIRVASRKAADMLAAHHGDMRNSRSVTCPRLTHIVLLNGGDVINVLSLGDPNPRPLHRSVTNATMERAALNLAERRRRERARQRRDRKRNG